MMTDITTVNTGHARSIKLCSINKFTAIKKQQRCPMNRSNLKQYMT